MKKLVFGFMALLAGLSSGMAQDYMINIHRTDNTVKSEMCDDIKGVTFKSYTNAESKPSSILTYLMQDQSTYALDVQMIDSITFSLVDTVKITYAANTVVVENPVPELIQITTAGAGVTVNALPAVKNAVYLLKGNSSNGFFLHNGESKYTIVMDNLTLASATAQAPIRSYCGKSMNVVLRGANSLTDCALDTCNATLRSKGQIVFSGDGSLVVKGLAKRAIQSADYIEVNGGNITAEAEQGDAMRANDYYLQNGGTVALKSRGLSVEKGYVEINGGALTVDMANISDTKGIKCNSDSLLPVSAQNGSILINGGSVTVDVKGLGSRCIKADGDLVVKAGTLNLTVNGSALEEPEIDDRTYSAAVKTDGWINLQGGQTIIKLSSAALGSRGLTADRGVRISNDAVLSIDAACEAYPYLSSKGKQKYKAGLGIKSDTLVSFEDKCSVNINATATSNSAICVLAEVSGINVNGGTVICKSATNAAMGLVSEEKDEDQIAPRASINVAGGLLIAAGGRGFSPFICGMKYALKGGVMFAYAGNRLKNSASSTQPILVDPTYQLGSAVLLTNNAGVSYLFQSDESQYTDVSAAIKDAVLQISSPLITATSAWTYSPSAVPAGAASVGGYYPTATTAAGTGVGKTVTISSPTGINVIQ